MGIFRTDFEFHYPAPTKEEILEAINNSAGLKISVTTDILDSEDEEEYKLHDHYFSIAFDDFPENTITLSSYNPEGLKKFNQEMNEDMLPLDDDGIYIHGSNEKKGKQNLTVESYINTEHTLYFACEKTLIKLGGKNNNKTSSEDSEVFNDKYSLPVTLAELQNRHHTNLKENKKTIYLGILMLPITIPIGIFCFFWEILKMPFNILHTRHKLVKKYPDQFYFGIKNPILRAIMFLLLILWMPIAIIGVLFWMPFFCIKTVIAFWKDRKSDA